MGSVGAAARTSRSAIIVRHCSRGTTRPARASTILPMRRSFIVFAVLLAGCPRPPPVSPRGLEENERCARFLTKGKLDDAEVACDHGLRFAPDYADLWVNKGLIAKLRGL